MTPLNIESVCMYGAFVQAILIFFNTKHPVLSMLL